MSNNKKRSVHTVEDMDEKQDHIKRKTDLDEALLYFHALDEKNLSRVDTCGPAWPTVTVKEDGNEIISNAKCSDLPRFDPIYLPKEKRLERARSIMNVQRILSRIRDPVQKQTYIDTLKKAAAEGRGGEIFALQLEDLGLI